MLVAVGGYPTGRSFISEYITDTRLVASPVIQAPIMSSMVQLILTIKAYISFSLSFIYGDNECV